MEVKKVGLLGGRGYVGRELIKLLDQHKRSFFFIKGWSTS